MSDHSEWDKLRQSLDVSPDVTEKQRVRALFLQRAEESVHEQHQKPVRLTRLFQRGRHSFVPSLAGIAAMLILFVGVLSAYNPAYLTGSISSGGDIIQYRMFPAGQTFPDLDTARKLPGELTILYAPGVDEAVIELFTKTDIPSPTSGFTWYMTSQNSKNGSESDSFEKEPAQTINEIQYIPVNRSEYTVDYGNAVSYGELVLLQASDRALIKNAYLPCSGQTLNAKDYPQLASILAPGAEKFTLPDLTSQSPLADAIWCIAAEGDYPYIDLAD